MQLVDGQERYYAARASEYDVTSGYQSSRALIGLAPVKAQYQLAFQDQNVLEVACGTGYWTDVVASVARSVCATDVNAETIAVARERMSRRDNVTFRVADAYTLKAVGGPFDGAYAQFWWSHIARARIGEFVRALHTHLRPGARVMFLDSVEHRYKVGRRIDEAGDLREPRTLLDGTEHEVIKNFPTRAEMVQTFAGVSEDLVFREYPAEGIWVLSYRTKQ